MLEKDHDPEEWHMHHRLKISTFVTGERERNECNSRGKLARHLHCLPLRIADARFTGLQLPRPRISDKYNCRTFNSTETGVSAAVRACRILRIVFRLIRAYRFSLLPSESRVCARKRWPRFTTRERYAVERRGIYRATQMMRLRNRRIAGRRMRS